MKSVETIEDAIIAYPKTIEDYKKFLIENIVGVKDFINDTLLQASIKNSPYGMVKYFDHYKIFLTIKLHLNASKPKFVSYIFDYSSEKWHKTKEEFEDRHNAITSGIILAMATREKQL